MSKRSKDPDPSLEEKIRALKEKAEELGIEAMELGSDTPQELQHTFWTDLLAYETTEPRPVFDVLEASGVDMPPPFKLSDEEITEALWRIIHGLAFVGAFLHHTDHLSDRELYSQLWEECLRQPAVLLPGNPSFGYHIDLIGGTTAEEEQIRLRFYADDEERAAWAAESSPAALPPSEDPPYQRDERLPRQPAGRDPNLDVQ